MGVGAHYRRGPVPFALHARVCSWKYALKLALLGKGGMEILFLGTHHSPELEAESDCLKPNQAAHSIPRSRVQPGGYRHSPRRGQQEASGL